MVRGAPLAAALQGFCASAWNTEPSSAWPENKSEPERKIVFLLNVEIQGVFVGTCVSALEHFYICIFIFHRLEGPGLSN